jgi:N-methylhydantoinase B
MAHSSVNPITVEVVRNGLAHIANEMATVLRKTSYNMMIYEVRDYCVGIVDPDGNILSQNFGALPIFLADLGPAIVDGVRMHGRDGFKPGDVLIMNHPYVCGQHLNNVVVYTPFFHDGELVAFLAVRAHWIDIAVATSRMLAMRAMMSHLSRENRERAADGSEPSGMAGL